MWDGPRTNAERQKEATMDTKTRIAVESNDQGYRTWRAAGDTYAWRAELKIAGFRWDALSRAWYRSCDASKMPRFRQAVVDIHDNSNGAVRFTVSG